MKRKIYIYICLTLDLCQAPEQQFSYRFRDTRCGSANVNGIVWRCLRETQPSVSHCRDTYSDVYCQLCTAKL